MGNYDHLSEEPSDVNTRELFLEIRNCIDSKVIGLINHYEFFKNLGLFRYFYAGRGKVSWIYAIYKAFYWAEERSIF